MNRDRETQTGRSPLALRAANLTQRGGEMMSCARARRTVLLLYTRPLISSPRPLGSRPASLSARTRRRSTHGEEGGIGSRPGTQEEAESGRRSRSEIGTRRSQPGGGGGGGGEGTPLAAELPTRRRARLSLTPRTPPRSARAAHASRASQTTPASVAGRRAPRRAKSH